MGIFLDERAYYNAENNLNRIKIGPVTGILKEPLQISVEANWENIFTVSDLFRSVKGSLELIDAGTGILNTGVWTRKFYKGGSYLVINPKIRIVEMEGNGVVLKSAMRLLDTCLPKYSGDEIQRLVAAVERFGDKIEKNGGVIKTGIEEAAEVIVSPYETVKNFITSVPEYIRNVQNSNTPRAVDVQFSNFFKKSFIVNSVQVEFSKEMTAYGPLYADFDITLSTQEVVTRGATGLFFNGGDGPTFEVK